MDPNTAIVFETIGLIKKSLQCSICLDLFNDPHSTRCNHQFCSRCIRKVVDERKEKKQEALCPLCKNPITKRSLTSNPRLKEIVDVVRRLNDAFQEDAGIPDSPYPLVNTRLNGENRSYLQFALLNPTPLKPTKFKSPTLCGVTKEQQLDSSVNLESSNHSLHSREQLGHEKPSSPWEVVSQQRRSTGFEILSLLESEEDVQPEAPTKSILDEEVSENDKPLQENCVKPIRKPIRKHVHIRNTEFRNTRRSSQPTQSQTAKSQENVNTAKTKSSGSLTIDAGKSSQSSVLSNNSVSMLDGLLSQQSGAEVENMGIEEADGEVSLTEQDNEPCHSFTVNKKHISKSSQEGNNDNCPLYTSNSERVTPNLLGNSNDMFNELQKSPNDKHEFRRTPEVACRKSGQRPSSVNSNKSNSNKSNLNEEEYSSERVPASVDSDSQSYKVIPLPRYKEYHSNDAISPEFLCPEFRGVRSRHDNCSDEIINPIAEKISSQDELCPASEEEQRCDAIQTEQSKVATSVENIPSLQADSCKNRSETSSEASVILPSQSGSSLRLQKSKRKRSVGDNDSLKKYPRLSDERRVSKISIENDNETCEHDGDKNVLSTLETDHSQVNSHAKEVSKGTPKEIGKGASNKFHTKVSEPGVKNVSNDQQNCWMLSSQVAKKSDDSEDDIIPPTPPVRMDLGCAPPKNGSTIGLNQLKTSRSHNVTGVKRHVWEDEVIDEDCFKGDVNDGVEESRTSKLQNVTELKRHVRQGEIVDEDCFKDDAGDDDGKHKTSRSQNIITGKESVPEDKIVDEDDWLKNSDDEGELMVVSDGDRSPIMEDDQMYSSQEDLNVALLRRLAPGTASHKESEIESDGETSDCVSTSISSLTDGDGVEVTSQRIKYLHEVLAQTGGEIEKLTTDLKQLRKSEVTAQTDKPKYQHGDLDKENYTRNRNNDVFENDISNEEEKNCESDKENDIRDSDEDLSCEKENENSETSDIEENKHVWDDANESSEDENENGETFNIVNDVRKNYNHYDSLSDKDMKDIDKESDKDDDMKENDHVVEVDDNGDSDNSNDDDDDEILERCTLSPPPALDPSTLKLTKLPPAVQNLQKLLQQGVDSEEEQNTTNYKHSSPDKSDISKALSVLHKVFGNNKRSNDDLNLEEVGLKDRSCDAPARKERQHGYRRMNKSVDSQIVKNEGRLQGSQKENGAELKRRSISRDLPTRRSQDTDKKDRNVKKNGGQPDGVLTEQRKLTSMLANGMNHEAVKLSKTVRLPLCFVITRLPKQFVSLAGYLAKRNGGKVSGDVSEEITHIIMPTDSKMHASRKNYTIKYLLGIALGKWIVSQLWITACVKSGRLVDEKQYEVKGDVEAAQSHVPNLARTTRENKGPLLFDSISVICFGEFNGAISQGQVCQLVRYCGGKVVDSQEFLNHRSTVSDLIVICDSILSEKTGLQIEDLCKRYSTFPVSAEWITDSVANYQLQDIEEYRMKCHSL